MSARDLPPQFTLPARLHIGSTGKTIAREDLDTLTDEELQELWYQEPDTRDGHMYNVWPWAPQSLPEALPPSPPAMRFIELTRLGMDDDGLQKAYDALVTREPDVIRLSNDKPDDRPTMERRKQMFDFVMTSAYAPREPPKKPSKRKR